MHYGGRDFSRNGGNTIEKIDPNNNEEMGQRRQLSELDKKQLLLLYNCPSGIMYLFYVENKKLSLRKKREHFASSWLILKKFLGLKKFLKSVVKDTDIPPCRIAAIFLHRVGNSSIKLLNSPIILKVCCFL